MIPYTKIHSVQLRYKTYWECNPVQYMFSALCDLYQLTMPNNNLNKILNL